MADLGLKVIRIGEFSWSKIQPQPNIYDWQWLDAIIDILNKFNLKIVLGTPSATPPRWLSTKYPDMLALDRNNNVRKFGSRRHYCFSHLGYRDEATLIAEKWQNAMQTKSAIGKLTMNMAATILRYPIARQHLQSFGYGYKTNIRI